MQKRNFFSWIVAVILVVVTVYAAIHVHKAEQANAIKMEKRAQREKRQKAIQKKLTTQQKKALQDSQNIDWNKPSESLPYPDLSLTKYQNTKKHKHRLWIEVSPKKQRVYIRSGKYTIYTMYASIAKNYENHQSDYQKTPEGHEKIEKRRGTEYFDETKGYGAKYWTSFKGDGVYRFESVPFNKDGKVITKQAKMLGQKVTRKHNVKAYGSIRLTVSDAKWIMENVPAKTKVVIHDKNNDDSYLEFLDE